MKISNKSVLEEFAVKHSDCVKPLQRWIERIEEANWRTHLELKADFQSADYVGNGRYVFNIKGNNYRVIAVVIFIAGFVTIRYIGTHSEYDKIDAKTV